jgi:hypothetical protein
MLHRMILRGKRVQILKLECHELRRNLFKKPDGKTEGFRFRH